MTTPDVIKLDRSIVAGAATDSVLRSLVRSLSDFGHGLGASVVAEGIETLGEFEAAVEAGVDYAQGYLLGRPACPAPDLIWPGTSR